MARASLKRTHKGNMNTSKNSLAMIIVGVFIGAYIIRSCSPTPVVHKGTTDTTKAIGYVVFGMPSVKGRAAAIIKPAPVIDVPASTLPVGDGGQIATLDTIIAQDSVHIDYVFPPINYFSFEIKRHPITVEVETVMVRRIDTLRIENGASFFDYAKIGIVGVATGMTIERIWGK